MHVHRPSSLPHGPCNRLETVGRVYLCDHRPEGGEPANRAGDVDGGIPRFAAVSFAEDDGSRALGKGVYEREEDGCMEELNRFDVQSLAGWAKELPREVVVHTDQPGLGVSPCVCVVLRPPELSHGGLVDTAGLLTGWRFQMTCAVLGLQTSPCLERHCEMGLVLRVKNHRLHISQDNPPRDKIKDQVMPNHEKGLLSVMVE